MADARHDARLANAALVLATLALAACDDASPPHWVEVCIEQHQSGMTPVLAGKTTILLPVHVCARWEKQCITGENYRGAQQNCRAEDGTDG